MLKQRYFSIVSCITLAACAGSAPPLPSANAPANSRYLALSCPILNDREHMLTAEIAQLQQENYARHNDNQVASYIGGFVPPAYIFTDSNSPTDQRYSELLQDRDQLNIARRQKGCL